MVLQNVVIIYLYKGYNIYNYINSNSLGPGFVPFCCRVSVVVSVHLEIFRHQRGPHRLVLRSRGTNRLNARVVPVSRTGKQRTPTVQQSPTAREIRSIATHGQWRYLPTHTAEHVLAQAAVRGCIGGKLDSRFKIQDSRLLYLPVSIMQWHWLTQRKHAISKF